MQVKNHGWKMSVLTWPSTAALQGRPVLPPTYFLFPLFSFLFSLPDFFLFPLIFSPHFLCLFLLIPFFSSHLCYFFPAVTFRFIFSLFHLVVCLQSFTHLVSFFPRHSFKKQPLLLISIDGLRAEYLQTWASLIPVLDKMST